jgi:hypothetical protein
METNTPTSSLACLKFLILQTLVYEREAKDLSCFCEQKHPHHLHMSDKKSSRAIKSLVQNEVTNVEI